MFLDLIPARGPARRLVGLTVVQSAANGLFLTSSAVFFVKVVGLTAGEVGIGLSVAGLAGFLATVPAGRLADRYGAGRLLALGYAALALLFAGYPLVRGFAPFVVMASLISIGEITGSPLRAAVMHALLPPEETVRTRAQVRSAYNAGFLAGAAVAGLALGSTGYPAFWAVCGTTAVAQAVCVAVVLSLRVPVPPAGEARSRPPIGSALRDYRFVGLTVGNGLLELHLTVLTVGAPLWIVSHTDAPASLASALMITNAVVVLLLQVRASRGAETVPGSARLLRRAGLLLAAGCAVCATSRYAGPVVAAALLAAGVVLLALGEIAQAAGGWGLSFALAPPGRQGEYQGVFALGRGVQQFLGPGLVTALLVGVGAPGWLLLAALFGLTGLLCSRLAARAAPAVARPDLPAAEAAGH